MTVQQLTDNQVLDLLAAILRNDKTTLQNLTGLHELGELERRYLMATCSARIMELAICLTANYDLREAQRGLQALVGDMQQRITLRCSRQGRKN